MSSIASRFGIIASIITTSGISFLIASNNANPSLGLATTKKPIVLSVFAYDTPYSALSSPISTFTLFVI